MTVWHISIDAVGGAHRLVVVDGMGDEPEAIGDDRVVVALAASGVLPSICAWVARHAEVHWSPPWRSPVTVATAHVTGTDPDADGVDVSIMAHVGRDGVVVMGDHDYPLPVVVALGDCEVEVEVPEWAVVGWAEL